MQTEGGLFGNVRSQPACGHCCLDPGRLVVMGEPSSSTAAFIYCYTPCSSYLRQLPQVLGRVLELLVPGALGTEPAWPLRPCKDPGRSPPSASVVKLFPLHFGLSTKQRVALSSRASSSLPVTQRWLCPCRQMVFRTFEDCRVALGMPLEVGCFSLASQAALSSRVLCVFDVCSVSSSKSVESGRGPGQAALGDPA